MHAAASPSAAPSVDAAAGAPSALSPAWTIMMHMHKVQAYEDKAASTWRHELQGSSGGFLLMRRFHTRRERLGAHVELTHKWKLEHMGGQSQRHLGAIITGSQFLMRNKMTCLSTRAPDIIVINCNRMLASLPPCACSNSAVCSPNVWRGDWPEP
eukprot:6413124-Amphidinium_carterae.2